MRPERPDQPARAPGRGLALALAVVVHAAFIAVLVLTVRWQNAPPEAVTAELYAPPVKAPVPDVPPAQPAPAKAEATPPKPSPEPPPKPAATPAPSAADIGLKQKQEVERNQREAAERERKDAEKRDADKKKQEEQKRLAETRERQSRESEALRVQAEREKAARDAQQQAVAAEATARSRAEADYIRRIQAKVKGNVILPPEMSGNPEAIFEVVQLPTGEIIDAVLKKSSGMRAYDDAVQRAIVKSSPLPRPDRQDLFQRALTLKFRPEG